MQQQSLSAYVCTQPGCTRARADGHAREFELEHRLRTMQRVRGRRPVAKCSFLCLPQRPGWFQRLSYPRQQEVLIQLFLLLLSRLRLALKELFRAVCLPAGTLGEQELRGRTTLRRQCLGTEGGRDAVQGQDRGLQAQSGETWGSRQVVKQQRKVKEEFEDDFGKRRSGVGCSNSRGERAPTAKLSSYRGAHGKP